MQFDKCVTSVLLLTTVGQNSFCLFRRSVSELDTPEFAGDQDKQDDSRKKLTSRRAVLRASAERQKIFLHNFLVIKYLSGY
jgi:hypothetical protein